MVGGAIVAVIGLYFMFVRPPLLPEDLRLIGASAASLAAQAPGLRRWLAYVFLVMGGYIFAAGTLTAYIAAVLLRKPLPGAWLASALAAATSIGLMTAVNFAIGSDYKWHLLAVLMIWVGAFLLHGVARVVEKR